MSPVLAAARRSSEVKIPSTLPMLAEMMEPVTCLWTRAAFKLRAAAEEPDEHQVMIAGNVDAMVTHRQRCGKLMLASRITAEFPVTTRKSSRINRGRLRQPFPDLHTFPDFAGRHNLWPPLFLQVTGSVHDFQPCFWYP